MESNIYPIAIYLDDEGAVFNRDFFYHTPNLSSNYLSEDTACIECLRLIEVSSYRPGHRLDIVMDDEEGRTVAYLVPK